MVDNALTTDPVKERMGKLLAQSQRVVAMVLARQAGAAGLLQVDPLNAGGAFARFGMKVATSPLKVARAQWHLIKDVANLGVHTTGRLLRRDKEREPVIAPAPSDRRFRDKAWAEQPVFDFVKQFYLLTNRFAQELVANADGLDPSDVMKVEFYTRQFMDAFAPTNFPLTNPEVLRATVDSRGKNLLAGMENLVRDLQDGQGSLRIKVTDESAFEVGRNLAVTPGKVIWRNDLMELIHYAPLKERVYSTPVLFIPPWINKFFILDLRPENSMVRYLLDQGHNVFLISWVNPDERHAQKGFGDYLKDGPLTALEVMKTVTGQDRAHAVGYCLGGTLLACLSAYLAAHDDKRLCTTTYFTSLTDFSEVGELSMFVEKETVDQLDAKMQKRGYLKGEEMSFPFNLMRSNDLIWNHVVNNYLLGKQPFPFDMLYWASDSTRMPAAMHSFYLRNMYVENRLVEKGGINVLNTPLDLTAIRTPTFMVSTREDHIAPWQATYKLTQRVAGPIQFVLSGSGHIAGIINPPPGKYAHWVGPSHPADPDAWLAAAQETKGSWWPRWQQWLAAQAPEMTASQEPGGGKVPIVEDAPGSYVKIREAQLPQAW